MIKLDLNVIYSEKMRMNISMMNLSFNPNSKVNTIPDVLIDFFLNHMSITEENKDVSCLLFARVPSGLLYVVDVFEETEEGADCVMVAKNYISLAPIHFDLTHYPSLDILKDWKIKL